MAELEEHYEPHPIAGIEALGRAATGGATHSRVPPPRHPALEEGNRRSGVVEKAPVVEVNHDRCGKVRGTSTLVAASLAEAESADAPVGLDCRAMSFMRPTTP